MARATVIVTNYGFNKPPMLTESEFKSYKQIFQVEPTYNMAPPKSFWDEFVYEKWLLVGVFGGVILGLIWDPLAFIFGISLILLIGAMMGGSAQSMWNYQSFLNVKNRYYEGLKQAIISSNNYQEFRQKALSL
jgi:hypothetical protein